MIERICQLAERSAAGASRRQFLGRAMKNKRLFICTAWLATVLMALACSASAEEMRFAASGSMFIAGSQGNRRSAVIAEGQGSHVGAFTGTLDIAVHGTTSIGAGEFATPCGDAITFVTRTRFDPALPGQVGTYVIVGGTGRFEGATGSGVFQAVITGFDPVETLDFIFAGTIDF